MFCFIKEALKDIAVQAKEVGIMELTHYDSYNVQVFKDTRKRSLGEYADDTKVLIKNTKVYEDLSGVSIEEPVKQEISFTYAKTTEEGLVGAEEGMKTAVLNFADALIPGGLVLEGADTQEECLCRCSNLYESLTAEQCIQGYYGINAKYGKGDYTDRLIYSPDVLFFKDDEYWLINEPKKISVITTPFPVVDCASEEIYKRRIECILKVAASNSVKYLVLGAIGTGAFGNPVEAVARAFAEVLSERRYVENIVFAIPKLSGVDTTHGVFKETFYKYYKEV